MTEKQDNDDSHIAVVGLGYVGLTLGVALAETGLKVTGLEVRSDIVKLTNKGIPHFQERGLQQSLERLVNQGLISATEDTEKIKTASVFFITVGTPLNDQGEINLGSIKNASHQVAKVMPKNALIIYRSTMQVGTARNIVKPIIESYGKKYRLSVCPERTLEGKALEELRSLPQIIGGFDEVATERSKRIFDRITKKIINVSSPETAEVMKLVDNTYRDVQFGFGNEVANLCNAIEGVDASEVIRLGKMGYKRTNVALPGLVGGPCLSKDPHILSQSAKNNGASMSITNAARKINESAPYESVKFILDSMNHIENISVTIAGFAFKGVPETDDLRGSMSIEVLRAFEELSPSIKIKIFDPIVKKEDLMQYSNHCFNKFSDSIADSHIIVICNNHEFFSNCDLRAILEKNKSIGMVYDFWDHFHYLDSDIKKDLKYVSFGSHWLFNQKTIP